MVAVYDIIYEHMTWWPYFHTVCDIMCEQSYMVTEYDIIYDQSYMVTVYDIIYEHIYGYRWVTVYDVPYMIETVYDLPYMIIPYMIDCIWFVTYECAYMITCMNHIWLSAYELIYELGQSSYTVLPLWWLLKCVWHPFVTYNPVE